MKKKIYVTQPSLPDLNDFIPYLEKIWKSHRLTNKGPFHEQFEKELSNFLGVKYVSLFANGTLALITALQVMRITGEVITTPYSFVATTHALWWNKITPVFVDIEPTYCTLDTRKIEAAITPQTTAIVPVHIYGNPCNIVKIEKIAAIYGLKVIYDAAHAFGVQINNNSILNYGEMSILSFHATKMFNTMEGGAIICQDEKTKQRIDYAKNFGFAGETTVVVPGINAKLNEMQSSLGLLQLKQHKDNVNKRKSIAEKYRNALSKIPGVTLLPVADNVKWNYGYFPIFIDEAAFGWNRDYLYEKLKDANIFCRRYFYPLISQFSPYRGLPSADSKNLPTAIEVANKVLCLPIYSELEDHTLEKIFKIIKS